jgi:phosphate transport system substrate-binding protein
MISRFSRSLVTRSWGTILFLCLASAGQAFAEPVRIGGTGSGSVLMERLAQEYQRRQPGAEVTIVMPPLSSGGGLRALSAGKLDIAVVGRALKPDEASMPGVGKSYEYARTPLLMASSRDTAKAVSLKELADIYSGHTVSWPDGSPIRLILRSKSESDVAIMRAASPEMNAAVDESYARKGMAVAENDIDTIDLIARTPGSLGPTTLGLLTLDGRRLSILALNGVQPTLAAMAAGKYPWVKSIHLAHAGSSTPETQEFLAFLRSDDARRLLAKLEFRSEAP